MLFKKQRHVHVVSSGNGVRGRRLPESLDVGVAAGKNEGFCFCLLDAPYLFSSCVLRLDRLMR